ncbi:Calcium-transporting ATPase type 2C member 2 [Balamuthia mandrillaris]
MNKEHSIYVRVNSKEATDINHEDHDSKKRSSGRSSWSLDSAWRLGVEEVVEFMQSDSQAGLTEREAELRLQQLGPNSLVAKEQESLVIKYLEQFKEPLILLLLCSCLVSVLIGELADAFGIFIAVCTVNTVGFIQEYRSEKSVEALQNLVAHRTHVLRDGQPREVLAESLVPGDLVVLNVGDRVPADLRLIETINLELDESILTGETEPSVKCTEQLSSSSSPSSSSSSVPEGGILEGRPRRDTEEFQLAERSNMAYMGTITVNGKGKGLVVATSTATELGRIWEAITSMGEKRTPLQLKMDQLGKQLSLAAFVIVGVIFILGAIQGKPLLQMFTIGVSLAVAAIPEGLPIVVTVTLALGVTRMANRHAIVRKLPAVEALGATTAICSDKTGTLTKNEMTVRRLFTTEFISVSGEGYHHQFWQQPQGEFFREGCDQPFDPAQDPHLMQLIQVCCCLLLVNWLCKNGRYPTPRP